MNENSKSYLIETGFLKNNGHSPSGPTGHRKRVYERFDANDGINGFQEKEILEMLLFYAIDKLDTKQAAEKMLDKFGTLEKVLSMPLETLASVPISIKKQDGSSINLSEKQRWRIARLIKLVFQTSVYINKTRIIDKPILNNQANLLKYLKSMLNNLDNEELHVLLLDSKNRLKKDIKISTGIENQTAFFPKQILKKAINYNANAIILVHNHPSGNLTPSNADIKTTEAMASACDALDIKLHDHLIIGNNITEYYSFQENGYL